MKFLLVLSLCFMVLPLQAQVIHFDSSGFFGEVVREAIGILPRDFLNSVYRPITIREVSLKSDRLFEEDLCQQNENVKFGLTRKYSISISSALVRMAKLNKSEFNCGHQTFRRMLLAVIIHELTHVKDNAEKISIDPDFQRIVGMKRIQRSSKKKLMNRNSGVSPDAYEFKNLEESLAVNTEYLILDPEFECRKPATAGFLSKKLGVALKGKCQKSYNVLKQSAFLEDNYQRAVSIDPTRVYQVHYLFAGKGEEAMSRWGHAMFRLVICAPFRRVVGPECMQDVSYHLSLSYRAYMNDISISYSKGMFGKYPSQLFIMSFLEVQQEYTKFGLRDLYSVPLKMTPEQQADFIDLTLERFWTYQGKYYFIDNNCGTETAKHLAVALDEDDSELISSITPLKMYQDIINKNNNLTEGEHYLIPSMFKELNENYQYLREYLPSFKETNFKKFLKKTDGRSRFSDYEFLLNRIHELDRVERKQVVLKLIYLERYLSNLYLMKIPRIALKKMNQDKNLKAQVMKMGEGLNFLGVQPWEVIISRFGVPTVSEFDSQFLDFLKTRKSDIEISLESQMKNLQRLLGTRHFQKELSEIEELKKVKQMVHKLQNQVGFIL